MKLDKAAILIKKAALEFDKMSNTVLAAYDLTPSQYKVLKYVYLEDNVRITDLEKYYSITHPTAIGIVKNLIKKGLVEYQKNPNDARSRFIVPTKKALIQKDDLESLGMELETKLTNNLSDKERNQLIALLRKMLNITGQ